MPLHNNFIYFQVLHKIITGNTTNEESGLSQPSLSDDFDPNILLDNFEKSSPNSSPTKSQQYHQAIILCAKTVLAHIVTHLGHFPMAIGAARLCSLVVEHDDVPNITSDELSANIFSAPNIQVSSTIPSTPLFDFTNFIFNILAFYVEQ